MKIKYSDHPLIARISELDKEISLIAQNNSVTQGLQQLRGVGPLVVTALVATIGTGQQVCQGQTDGGLHRANSQATQFR